MKKYSVIIPVYNRPDEMDELLESLSKQSYKDFEMIIVEDGSTLSSKDIVQKYADILDIKYFFKENSGPGDSRNYGMAKAEGEYLIFFDSDCIIPPDYFSKVEKAQAANRLDAFGGPDAAHPSFSITQKAINQSMTSFLTTGGIRGKKNQLDTFQPRSFNMGISRKVYEQVGGFGNIHPGEDPELSYKIMNAGFKVGLIPDAEVFHKRRIDLGKFIKQVYKFGVVRPILMKWFPDKFKITYLLPSVFLLGTIGLIFLGIFYSEVFFYPLAIFACLVFLESLFKTWNPIIAVLSVITSYIQLLGYGFGFLQSFFKIHILKQEERSAFPGFFFPDK